jgi:hypothetical protein
MKQQSKQPLTPGSKRRLENTDFPAYREFSKKSKSKYLEEVAKLISL